MDVDCFCLKIVVGNKEKKVCSGGVEFDIITSTLATIFREKDYILKHSESYNMCSDRK